MRRELSEGARLLAKARREGYRVTLDRSQRPVDWAEAYAVQDAISRKLEQRGAALRGWKVGARDAKSMPTAAPIYDVISGPARIAASRLNMIGVEAEIAYVFGSALPPRATLYSVDDVLSAVRAVCVAIEVCDSRLADWQSADDLTKLADHQLNHALVIGDTRADIRGIDYRRQAVRTSVNGKVLNEGIGCHALDNPATLLPWLANHAAARGGLHEGVVVTTGSWLGMHFVAPGDEVTIEFPGIGRAVASFPDA